MPGGWYAQLGHAHDTDAAIIGATWPWQREWPLGTGILTGYWELSLGRWNSHEPAGNQHAWVSQFGVTPVFRYRGEHGSSPWFAELGIGANVITPAYRGNNKRFQTRFNFGDHIAVGWSYGAHRRYELSLRYEHFSNAGIERPNPGEEFIQLRHAWRFD